MIDEVVSFEVITLQETQILAHQLAELLFPQSVLLLHGNLGSGKTAFVQFLGQSLGITAPITSPTFTLIDVYLEGRMPLYHVDLYRLEPIAVPSLHLPVYWQGDDFPLGIVAIEWADRLNYLPKEYLVINFDYLSDDTARKITFRAEGNIYRSIVKELKQKLA